MSAVKAMGMNSPFQIVDLGVHHPDYFQGFGTSFTRFEHSVYGIGDTAEDAYQDALQQMAESYLPHAIVLPELPEHCPFSGAVTTHPDDTGMNDDYNQQYYHVGIRWVNCSVGEVQS